MAESNASETWDVILDEFQDSPLYLDSGDRLLVSATGSILMPVGGSDGIIASSGNAIAICGAVAGASDYFGLWANEVVDVTVGVTGSFSGRRGIGIGYDHSEPGSIASTIRNAGAISGTQAAISSAHALVVNNVGVIQNTDMVFSRTAIRASGADDTIKNAGKIHGEIDLNDGNDAYYGREGFVSGGYIALGGGDDRAHGGAGAEYLVGGIGNDVLDGGTGSDTAVFRAYDMTRPFTVDLSRTGSQDTGSGFDTLTGIENIIADQSHYRLIGNGGENLLAGGSGDDALQGGAGNDVLFGGQGDDTLNDGAGVDTVKFDGVDYLPNHSPASHGESINLAKSKAQSTDNGRSTFISVENLIGTAHNHCFTGSSLANVLDGQAGDDILNGGRGKGILKGGAGRGHFSVRRQAEQEVESRQDHRLRDEG
ncbi:calcium-binding protein [Microvirga roseola]|uniref:calcium-binding protein n=1 Tax=Microvirga roseola TaxID=2883126 RepID=UPI001E3F061F|nr:calcium-binding protein [Microvirga roseola]